MPSRVLAITSQVPWPLTSGGHLRTFHMLAALSRAGFDVSVVAPVPESPDAAASAALQRAGITLQQVVVGRRTVFGEAVAGAHAWATLKPYSFYRRHHWRRVQSVVDKALTDGQVDALYLDHLDSFTYVDRPTPVPIVLDMHNVYSSVLARSARRASLPLRPLLAIEAAHARRAEAAAVRAADLTLAVSDDDAEVFRAMGASAVQTAPNGVDCSAYGHLPTGRDGSPHPILLFVGALGWPPNEAACEMLARHILPDVRRAFPSAEVHLVGRSPSQRVLSLGAVPGVHVSADVPDVLPHLASAAALVVPLDVGGGTRLKVLEAFAAGLPVVSTAIGCEGIACENGTHLAIAEVPAMGEAVRRVLDSPAEGRRLAGAARDLARSRYDWAIVGRTAARALDDMMAARSPVST